MTGRGPEFSELTPQELSEVFGGAVAAKAVTPDVCKTPSPGGPVPLPYPNAVQQ
jgi:hypothetical protein